jgi:acetyl esterase/lipase
MTENPRSRVAAKFSGEPVRIHVAMRARSYSEPYGTHREQVLDVHPAEGSPVVLLHGGFWRARYGRELMTPLAEDLAARGVTAVNAEYRRLDRDGGWPVTRDDVRAALAHVRERHAGGGPVVAVGHSAGGHLALLSGADAVVGQAAVADTEEAARLGLGDGVVERFAGGALAEASPLRHAPLGVPTLLVHGTADDTVSASLSERYAAAAGAECELSLRPGEGHFEHIDPRSGAWEEVVEWILRRR